MKVDNIHCGPQEQLEQLEKAAVQQQKRQAFLTDLRAEVERLQGVLAQHNLIIDAVVAKTPLETLQHDLQTLTQANAGAAEALGALAGQRAAAEAATRTLQAEAERLQSIMAEQIEALPDTVRVYYFNYKDTSLPTGTPAAASSQERNALEAMQAEVAALQQRVASAEEELATLEHQVAQAKQGAAGEVVACLAIMVGWRVPLTVVSNFLLGLVLSLAGKEEQGWWVVFVWVFMSVLNRRKLRR